MIKKSIYKSCLIFTTFLSFSCVVSKIDEPESLANFNYQTAISLEPQNSATDINGIFPEEIFIKTPTQTFNRDYQFCLVDGLIYYKSLPNAKYSNPGINENDWQLLKETGLPFAQEQRKFSVPNQIVEISADSDALYAFDEKGGMYFIFTNETARTTPFLWFQDFGWPERTQLKQTELVKNKRSWSASARRKDVLWHEDIYGNPHHYGTMGIETLYFLTEDGQQIRFTDSGLPADFSRSLLGPERGSFIAENLNASADTMFVINKAGEMYTRLADFDTIGCDPMFFKYTYEKLPQKYTGEQYLSNYSPWALPSEPWLKQPEIKLQGNARLTKHITILQNGRGNAARELRVAGLNKDAQTGFYSKQIMQSDSDDWKFVQVPLFFNEDDFLPVTKEGIPFEVQKNLYGKKQEFSYTGNFWKNGKQNTQIQCEIPDFPMSEGECTLFLTYKDETKKITLYPVEIWSYMFRNNPGLDGTAKNFFVTFDYEDSAINSKYPEFDKILKEIFADKKKVLFSSNASATNKYFKLSVKKTKYTFFLTEKNSSQTENATSLIYFESPSMLQYNSASLRLLPQTEISLKNRNLLDQIILANKKYKEMLQTELKIYKKYADNATLSRWGYNIADLLTTVTLLNQINFPKIKNVTRFGSQIMKQNAATYKTQSGINNWIYTHLTELVDLRIDVYKDAQKTLAKEKVTTIPQKLRDNFFEYYSVNAKIPLSTQGKSCFEKSPAKIFLMQTNPYLPALCIKINSENPYYIFVELKDSARTIYNTDEITSQNPLELKATFFTFSDSNIIPDEVLKTTKKDGIFYWDGKTLRVEAIDFYGKKTLLFESE